MTIAEIESTIKTLSVRHKNLNEPLLVTLLTASGWEEKTIQDALVIYRASYKKNEPLDVIKSSDFLSEKTTDVDIDFSDIVYFDDEGKEMSKVDPLFSEESKIDRPVLEKVDGTEIVKKSPKEDVLPVSEKEIIKDLQDQEVPSNEEDVIEKQDNILIEDITVPSFESHETQSLVVEKNEKPSSFKKESEPPENLPLKPFDSSPHVWPFSKYKEVFYKDDTSSLTYEEEKMVNENKNKKEEVLVSLAHQGPSLENEKKTIPTVDKKIKKLEKEDVSVFFMVILTILVISLLVIYMYSNGRF